MCSRYHKTQSNKYFVTIYTVYKLCERGKAGVYFRLEVARRQFKFSRFFVMFKEDKKEGDSEEENYVGPSI